MTNKNLKRALKKELAYAIDAQKEDGKYAQRALDKKQLGKFYEYSIHLQLSDIYWAQKNWKEAQKWYQHNADILMKKRQWHQENSGPHFPLIASANWEVSSLVKSGRTMEGLDHLKQVISYFEDESGHDLTLPALALYAAQAGSNEGLHHLSKVKDVRKQLVESETAEAVQVQDLLHYEFAQSHLLLNDWEAFEEELLKMEEAVQIIGNETAYAFPEELEKALTAATKGFRALFTLKHEANQGNEISKTAISEFENAMFYFYKFNEQVDVNVYFMRLNTRFANELAEGITINPNPF